MSGLKNELYKFRTTVAVIADIADESTQKAICRCFGIKKDYFNGETHFSRGFRVDTVVNEHSITIDVVSLKRLERETVISTDLTMIFAKSTDMLTNTFEKIKNAREFPFFVVNCSKNDQMEIETPENNSLIDISGADTIDLNGLKKLKAFRKFNSAQLTSEVEKYLKNQSEICVEEKQNTEACIIL